MARYRKGRRGRPGEFDEITYWPINRSRKAEDDVFSATDPRARPAVGGMRLDKKHVFVPRSKMPAITLELVAQACDNLAKGQDCYPSLLYMSRARPEDAELLFDACVSHEVKVRWERLWVLSPYFAKVVRYPVGREVLLRRMRDDLAALHLFSKFTQHNNPAVQRFYKRLGVDLLDMLMDRLLQSMNDPRRVHLISSIVATIERNADELRKILLKKADQETAEEALDLLEPRFGTRFKHRLSSGLLRERLYGWGR
jgi:hypothetical protein